jgi:hypothetical protein
VFPTASGAADPRHPLLANLAIVASRSSRYRNPSRGAAFPRECLYAEQTGSPPKLLDWKYVACRLSVFQVQVEVEVLCSAKVHHSLFVSPCPNHTNSWGFVRRSKDESWAAYRSIDRDHNRRTQEHVKLFSPTKQVREVLDMIGFSFLFEIFTDLPQALASFRQTAPVMKASLR